MKAIFFQAGKALDDPQAAVLREIETPQPTGRDVLVKIEAVALNPVDTKVRPDAGEDDAVLGYDAAGAVTAIGEDVKFLAIGDKVYYAGDIKRPGTNAEFQLVDERIVGNRPENLTVADAAALPLTALTAWEALFNRLMIDSGGKDSGRTLLIIGGAGGVGSIAIQLAKWAGIRVIATASREESSAWCRDLGADDVVNHHNPLRTQIEKLGLDNVDFIANFHDTAQYWETMGDLIAPQGRVVLIVESSENLPLGGAYKSKSVSISWEFMFTRSMFATADQEKQRGILNEIAKLIDAGVLRTTSNGSAGKISAENILAAHKAIESKRTVGKIVLAGW
ncbi:MAG: zinc-binding alcohol dehydrogenase family protein [Verrucomicrobiota bacterium]